MEQEMGRKMEKPLPDPDVRVKVHKFEGATRVSIRQYIEIDGKQLPTIKGVSLTMDEWRTFRDNIPAIDEAILEMGRRTQRSEHDTNKLDTPKISTRNILAGTPRESLPLKKREWPMNSE